MTCTCFSVKALVFCSEANTKQKHKVGLHLGGWNLLRLDALVQVGSQVPQCFLHVTKNQPFFIRGKHSWHQSKAHGKTRYMSSKLGDDTLVDSRFWRRSTASCNNSRACLSSFFHFCFRNKKSPFGTCDFSQLLTKSRKKFGTCHTLHPSTDGKWIHLFFFDRATAGKSKRKRRFSWRSRASRRIWLALKNRQRKPQSTTITSQIPWSWSTSPGKRQNQRRLLQKKRLKNFNVL